MDPCSCGCSCCSMRAGAGGSWNRVLKRRFDQIEEQGQDAPADFNYVAVARVEVENECVALRETLASQQQSIQDLYAELEEERNASSSAANEAMSMILRLQREKAEITMEARQFKRFAEEKMAHDQQELNNLEDMLYKKDQAVQSLSFEAQAYKHRMMSFGITESELEADRETYSRSNSVIDNSETQYQLPYYDYPPLKCKLNETQGTLEVEEDVDVDVEKYAFGETPRAKEQLQNLEYRIYQLENTPRSEILEKTVVGQSPRKPRHSRRFSTDSSSSFFGMVKETYQEPEFENPMHSNSFKKTECFPSVEDNSNLRKVDDSSEHGDDMSDRVYTIDSIHNGAPTNTGSKATVGVFDDYTTTPRDSTNRVEMEDPDVKKLYMRLQALEADRESMKQALISMRTDKAQLVLLREIAQHLYKDMTPERRISVKKTSIIGSISFVAVFKWVASFVFWRKNARQSKYTFGRTPNNVGLLMLLEKNPNMRQWRCLTKAQV